MHCFEQLQAVLNNAEIRTAFSCKQLLMDFEKAVYNRKSERGNYTTHLSFIAALVCLFYINQPDLPFYLKSWRVIKRF